jgi:hypothetical protein
VLVPGACSSADESLLSSLIYIHPPIQSNEAAETAPVTPIRVRRPQRPAA